ncbi:MAG TPA: hypothetical protein VFT65_01980 [Candidatus Angelobacter sp.]|nr:hypothetical protein [Candidatus Angelobacter sp.]
MKSRWLLLALLSGIRLDALQAATPQAALEELATATKPEVIARHLPEPVQKSIEVLPKLLKQHVMDQLLEMKDSQLNECTIRPAHNADGWEIIDENGETKGRVTLDAAYISGVDALLPLRIEQDGNSHTFIVTMHLEDDEWRLDSLGPWEKSDLGLGKLVHQPTQMEKNEEAAKATLQTVSRAVNNYAREHPRIGYPSSLKTLSEPVEGNKFLGRFLSLDASFAEDPLIKDGYRFRYLHTEVGAGTLDDLGNFEITAVPVEFGKTGSKSYFMNNSSLRFTPENRPATAEDARVEE